MTRLPPIASSSSHGAWARVAFAVAAVLSGCAASVVWAQTTTERMKLHGSVATVDLWREFPGTSERQKVLGWTFAADGTALESVSYAYSFRDGSLLSRRVTSYDEDGDILAVVTMDPADEPIARTDYRYDAEGRLIGQISYDAAGTETRRAVSTLDAAGHVVVDEAFENGVRTRRTEADVDADGGILEMRRFDGEDRLTEVRTYTEPGRTYDFVQYAEAGEVEFTGTVTETERGTERWISYAADGSLAFEFTWTFDEAGREMERREVHGEDTTVYRTSYEDDAAGNWIRSVRTEDRGSGPEPYEIRDREITYH